MSIEAILSLISLCFTSIIGVLTIIANIRISKISHLKDLHEYRREITYFELINRDEKWLYELIQNDEFGKYSPKAQEKIIAWYMEYKKTHPPVLLESDMDVEDIKRIRNSNVRVQMLLGAPNPNTVNREAVKKVLEQLKDEEVIKRLKEDIDELDDDDGSTDW